MARSNQPVDVFSYINMMNGDNESCWPWKGKTNEKDGRPYFTVQGKRRPSYVYVIELTTGKKQTTGTVVRHKCDNPICCNPTHLEWGSHQENMNDMKERDRHGVPKTVVRAIHNLADNGKTQQDIAEIYGLSREAVSAILTGRNKKIDN